MGMCVCAFRLIRCFSHRPIYPICLYPLAMPFFYAFKAWKGIKAERGCSTRFAIKFAEVSRIYCNFPRVIGGKIKTFRQVYCRNFSEYIPYYYNFYYIRRNLKFSAFFIRILLSTLSFTSIWVAFLCFRQFINLVMLSLQMLQCWQM